MLQAEVGTKLVSKTLYVIQYDTGEHIFKAAIAYNSPLLQT